MSHRSCSQGKLRACPLLHHPLKTSLDYYYSTIPRSFPDLTCNSSSNTSTITLSGADANSSSLLHSFIHCSNRASRHSFPAPFHSLPTALLFFVLGRLDTLPTRRLFSIYACSRTAALHIHLIHLNPTPPGRRTPVLDNTAFIPPNQPSSPPSSGPNYRRTAHSYDNLDRRVQ